MNELVVVNDICIRCGVTLVDAEANNRDDLGRRASPVTGSVFSVSPPVYRKPVVAHVSPPTPRNPLNLRSAA